MILRFGLIPETCGLKLASCPIYNVIINKFARMYRPHRPYRWWRDLSRAKCAA